MYLLTYRHYYIPRSTISYRLRHGLDGNIVPQISSNLPF
uniref:Uncharacterized protein n=1 Tax=viral metagenome TaxID=1070528 RepID=A0A6C0BLN8_9ZZZZ